MATSVSFIGNKITLISKAAVRYEGILFDVNTKDSTVTLSKGVFLGPLHVKCSMCVYAVYILGAWSVYS